MNPQAVSSSINTLWVSLAMIGSIVSCLVGLTVLVGFVRQQRSIAMEEGKRRQEFEHMQKDLQYAHDRIRVLEEQGKCTDKDITELKNDVKHILTMLDKIDNKMEHVMKVAYTTHGAGDGNS